MSNVIASGRPAWQSAGPPAARMAGRAQARAAAKPGGNYTPKAKPKISAATVERVSQFLDGEAVIDQAVHQGIIGASMASHFRALMKSDPTNTHAYLQRLGLHRASAGAERIAPPAGDDYPTAALSSAERSRIAAAREGRQSAIVHGGL